MREVKYLDIKYKVLFSKRFCCFEIAHLLCSKSIPFWVSKHLIVYGKSSLCDLEPVYKTMYSYCDKLNFTPNETFDVRLFLSFSKQISTGK
jgi:hypothetical protein